MFKRMILLVKPYWSRLALVAILSLIVSGMTGALAWLVKPALDEVFLGKDTTLLIILPIAVLGLFVARGCLAFFQAYLMLSVGAKVVRDIRNALYGHLLFLPINEFKKESSGAMLSRAINDAGQLQQFLAQAVKDMFISGTTVIVLIGVAFYMRWDLALIAIVVLPFAFYSVKRVGIRLKNVSTEAQKKISLITEFFSETISGIKMVKVFGKEGVLNKLFMKRNRSYYQELMRATRLTGLTTLIMEVIGGFGIASVLWYGGWLVIQGIITPGQFFAFLTAIFMVYAPAKRLAAAHSSIQQSKASLERIDELLDKEVETNGKGHMGPLRDQIEFRKVSFSYPGSKRDVLSNLSFSVKKGEIVAIVGRSGAGKTTLVDLIPRFYDPRDGAIYINGVNIADVSLQSLRQQIGLVSQDIILFNDTVRANIVFGSPDVFDGHIINAAKAAYANDFILELPEGYDTIIGEGGVLISGGQRQRISIARAILKNPSILILDEATSALDAESEMMVQMAIDALIRDRTTFVIAHRLSTVKNADRIIVLENGSIVEIGVHDELLKTGGIYKKLYDLQIFSSTAV
ncbi:ABC transporter transmembrane domain-containing protein [Thermodesulfovibrionales bacterium]|nr:ATP-binding cassette domain-containing protein [Thermodesulfovibrionales bacterium]MCL0047116.1 ABC transporter transmembrane domain-containing protein [Thermodesulfovibrionales bacterium]MCL0071228.1 ABC transporter transmembrane domain-containing protein [Thermodesulfovibrionales bacterium]MCL0086340.1 ABC transporter transmembrane domain-containing protein [Thermodesulfovibrionales bacterium]MCL0105909.1 ABC transporter transmembrane domain-containing protein [Thermodesulfovibrionales bac